MSRIIVPADAERVVPAAAVDATIAALRDVVAVPRQSSCTKVGC